jgi:hypothetical protein
MLREKGIVVSPELWRRVKVIVYEALDRDPAEWPSYLHETCEGDSELESEVSSLLEVSWSIGNFIEEPALEILNRELTRT